MHVKTTYNANELPLIADGDEQAFYKFYTHYAGLLRPFLLSYTRSQTDVEDIIQETFVRVWLNRDRLHEIENLPGWLYRIASRVYLDHLEPRHKTPPPEIRFRRIDVRFGHSTLFRAHPFQ